MRNLKIAETPASKECAVYRFDVFKGLATGGKSIYKIKTVGAAILRDRQSTYTLHLNTFMNEVFYLLPGDPKFTKADYTIMTRQNSSKPGRKYIWRPVGEGKIVPSENGGPMLQLTWDIIGQGDIFMKMTPITKTAEAYMVEALREVLKA